MNAQAKIAVVDDEMFDAHHDVQAHPECPERLAAARDGLRQALASENTLVVAARPALPQELALIHGDSYLNELERTLRASRGYLDPDTFFSAGSRAAAWSAAGGVIDLVNEAWSGSTQRGIALVRPPGHHAERDRAMGFCLLNNVAIAAASLLERGAQRVAVLDWDVHHGNGTQHSFYADPRVLFISLHQWPFYPGTGAPEEIGAREGVGFNANVALPAGCGPEAYASAFRRVVIPLLDAFNAEIVLVSAGFDAHARDPLASMHLDAASYQAMASALIEHVTRAGHGRVAWILEGGYDLSALSASVAAVARAALGQHVALPDSAPSAAQTLAIDRTVNALCAYWPSLR